MKIWNWIRGRGRGFTVVFGAVLVQLTLGTIFTIGNLGPYLISYLRHHNGSDVANNQVVWINALQSGIQGISMPLGGIIERRIGPRKTGLLGSVILSFGTAITYFTINTTYPFVLLTYGIVFGTGCGFAYIAMVTVGMKWFPNNRGVVNGVTIGAFAFASFVFSPVQTAFINPSNVSPGKGGYFTDDNLLSRVPYTFLMLGGVYAIMQLIGCLLVTTPSKEIVQENSAQPSLTTKQALKTKEFYILFLTMLLNIQAVTFFNSTYKMFGQTFIKDDHFLAYVGSACAVSNTLGRIVWGWLIDRFRYKKCMLCLCTYVMLFLLTMQFTRTLDKYVFAVWAFLLFLGLAGTYSLLPTCICHTYGPKYTGTIYGLVFAANIIGAPITAVTTQYLSGIIGFNGMFYLIAGCSFISFIITLAFQQRSTAAE